jgi:hypothetical protein
MADRSVRDCHSDECRDDIPLKESGSSDIIDDETIEYPSTIKFLPILIGLCFQSFCIALVSPSST